MILVTGAGGQLGQELQYLARQNSELEFLFVDSKTLDITDEAAVNQLFQQYQFHFCINCAAFTAVDDAEKMEEKARLVNVVGVNHLAKACKKYRTQLIHISSDYVYHSETINRPYREVDATNPQGVYAVTKLEGDELIMKMLDSAVILRTSWVYSSFGNNFVKTMLRLGRKLSQLRVIYDQIGTPTYARDLALAILHIIKHIDQQKEGNFGGIYHFSNEGVTSWYDFALAIFEIKNIDIEVVPIETKDYPTPAKRPHFSVMNKNKVQSAFNIKIPHWRKSLAECLTLMD